MRWLPFSSVSVFTSLVLGLTVVLAGLYLAGQPIQAQTLPATPAAVLFELNTEPLTSSPSAGTASGTIATASAQPAATLDPAVAQRLKELQDRDITQSSGEQKNKLVAYLEANPPEPLSWYNFLEHAIRWAIHEGVPANVLVLVLLFPLIASLIAASRHVIGLRGFGIYIPAVLSVALVSTGLILGTVIFLAIISVANFSKKLLRNLHLSYLPRTALLLWMISLAILGVLLLTPLINSITLVSVNIFPILILVLLSENFLDAQASTKPADAFWLAVETIGLAFISGFILRLEFIQRFALLEPELLILSIAVFNYLVGKFVGLRISELLRFRPIIEE